MRTQACASSAASQRAEQAAGKRAQLWSEFGQHGIAERSSVGGRGPAQRVVQRVGTVIGEHLPGKAARERAREFREYEPRPDIFVRRALPNAPGADDVADNGRSESAEEA